MEIRLKNNSIDILSRIKNNSNRIIPFSFGLHPYFKVSDLNEVSIKGLPEKCFNHKDFSIGKTNIELESLSKGIDLLSGPTNCSTLYDLKSNTSIVMITEKPFDLSVIWTDPPRRMVCLEPWTSPRNSLISGDRTIRLEPDSVQDLSLIHI